MRFPGSKTSIVADMGVCYEKIIRPALFRRDPEEAHEKAVRALRTLGRSGVIRNIMERWNQSGNADRPVECFGLRFANAVGLAAGFDKNALCWRGAAAIGFGHVEIGTVTWHSQPGNPSPRVFRYPEHEALINRMGFNNDGAQTIAKRLAEFRHKEKGRRIRLGINIGKSRVTPIEEAAEDYRQSFEALADFADYISINISSPNTPGLRKLQEEEHLVELLRVLRDANWRRAVAGGGKSRVPLLVKIAPDLSYRQIDTLLEAVFACDFDGIIATNTTLERPGPFAEVKEDGGLSGKPLRSRSTRIINYIHRASSGKIAIIGVGGVDCPEAAGEKMDAGASLVQLYSGMIFKGPFLARDIARALAPRQRPWI